MVVSLVIFHVWRTKSPWRLHSGLGRNDNIRIAGKVQSLGAFAGHSGEGRNRISWSHQGNLRVLRRQPRP
jgi:hypothetical protein